MLRNRAGQHGRTAVYPPDRLLAPACAGAQAAKSRSWPKLIEKRGAKKVAIRWSARDNCADSAPSGFEGVAEVHRTVDGEAFAWCTSRGGPAPEARGRQPGGEVLLRAY